MPAPNIRRSPRVPVELDVWLQRNGRELHYKTKDVSERGIFIVCLAPLALRTLLRFRAEVGDDIIPLFGLVSPRVDPDESEETNTVPGMGLQVFPVGFQANQVWQRVVERLYSRDPAVLAEIQKRELPVVSLARDAERLREFVISDVARGRTFCRTPESHVVGATVVCEIEKVDDGTVFSLPAIVAGVVEGSPRDRGLELVFHALTQESLAELATFADVDVSALLGGTIPESI